MLKSLFNIFKIGQNWGQCDQMTRSLARNLAILQHRKMAHWQILNAKVGSKFCQIQIKHLTFFPRFLEPCPICENSPNLVSVIGGGPLISGSICFHHSVAQASNPVQNISNFSIYAIFDCETNKNKQ